MSVLRKFAPRDPEQLARARAAASSVAERHPGTLVFLGGSPLVGLGTPFSDVDVFVMFREDRKSTTEQLPFDGQRVDVETHSLDNLRAVVECVREVRMTTEDLSQIAFATRDRLDMLLRFLSGEIVADDGTLTELAGQVSDREEPLQHVLTARQATMVGNHVEDVRGFVEVGDPHAARHMSVQALLAAAEALLARVGDPYLGPKWVWQKWARSVDQSYAPHIRELLFSRDLPGAVNPHLWAAQDLLVHAFGFGGYDPVAAAAEEPVRDPYATPIVTTDNVLMYRPGRQTARISTQGLLLWGIAHGRTRAEAVKLFTETPAGAGIAASAVGDYYDSLCRIGLIRQGEVR